MKKVGNKKGRKLKEAKRGNQNNARKCPLKMSRNDLECREQKEIEKKVPLKSGSLLKTEAIKSAEEKGRNQNKTGKTRT